MWFCYILRCIDEGRKNLTYGGSTNNIRRRIKQHNGGVKKGGAKATSGKQWEIYALMIGFESESNCRCSEWRINHVTGKRGKRPAKYCGVNGRIVGLNEVLVLNKWTKKCTIENKDCNFKLFLTNDVVDLIDLFFVPDNIEIYKVKKMGSKFLSNVINGTY